MADFVTQLLACEGRLPAYRARRRAEPGEASGRYGGDKPAAGPRARFERVL